MNTSVRDFATNGRVNILKRESVLPQLNTPTKQSNAYDGAMTGNWEETDLSRTYFCGGNIQILHNGMRSEIYRQSNGRYTIPEQDTDVLKTIMRAIYLESAEHRPTGITAQVAALNTIVIRFCVKQLYGELDGYVKYKEDASSLVVPLSHPIHVSNTQTLELKPWF